MMPLRISRLRFGFTPRRFGGTALSIDANCSSLSQNRSAIVLLHVNRGVESGQLESGQALETWELGFEPSPAGLHQAPLRFRSGDDPGTQATPLHCGSELVGARR